MSFMNGGGNQMPMMISSSASMCILAVGGGALLWFMTQGDKKKKEPEPAPQPDLPSGPVAPPGLNPLDRYYIQMGDRYMTVGASDCSNNKTRMLQGAEGDAGLWRFIDTGNGTYNVISNGKEMTGCNAAYLTASSSCNGTSLEEPKYLDRQEWQVIDVGNNRKMLKSVSCMNKNQTAMLSGAGNRDGNMGLTNKSGSPFVFRAVA